VLSGVILSAIAVAGIALVLSLSPSPWAAEIVRWLLGAPPIAVSTISSSPRRSLQSAQR
jgi:hypothetical protein